MIIVICHAIWFHLLCIFGPMRKSTITRLPFLVLKCTQYVGVYQAVPCLGAVVSAYSKKHNARAQCTVSCGCNKVNWTKHGEFCFANKDLFCCYTKQMNVFSFVQWNIYFHSVKDEMLDIQLGFVSLNGTFHLSPPQENMCTIALINIQYLHTIS